MLFLSVSLREPGRFFRHRQLPTVESDELWLPWLQCLACSFAVMAHGYLFVACIQRAGFVKVTVKKKAASGKPLPETVDLMKLGRHLLK